MKKVSKGDLFLCRDRQHDITFLFGFLKTAFCRFYYVLKQLRKYLKSEHYILLNELRLFNALTLQ